MLQKVTLLPSINSSENKVYVVVVVFRKIIHRSSVKYRHSIYFLKK